MAKRKKNFEELSDQQKYLYEWAEGLNEGKGEVSRFLEFCKRDDKEVHEAMDVITYSEFLVLKERFEAWI